MIELFAITHRGLERISAGEMGRVPGLDITQVAYRRIRASYSGELAGLVGLRTVDDVFINLAAWDGIVRQRSALARLTQLAERLVLDSALEAVARIRPLSNSPPFSITANFVGKRNYSSNEIKQALAAGICTQSGWKYAPENESEVNLRVFLEHEWAYVGLRLTSAPLHHRPYKRTNLPGSLKPTIAAAMLQIAGVRPGTTVFDPFCGAGTILIEAALSGAEVFGGDLDSQALAAVRGNAALANVSIAVEQWDARKLPLENRSVTYVVTNPPWGRQSDVGEDVAAFYGQVCVEIDRVLSGDGQVVVLTNLPQLLSFGQLRKVFQAEISLFGQTPAIVKFAAQ